METLPQSHNNVGMFSRLIDFLAKSREKGGVYGLQGSALSFFAACAANAGAPPVVIVAPDGETASAWAVDIRFYLGEDELFKQPLSDEVVRYPSSDVAPFSFHGLESDIWMSRMTALFRFSEGRMPNIICVGLDALIRKVVPRQAVRNAGFQVYVGQDIDRDYLLQRLVLAGYSRAPLVEDAGDFSVRGFILDVYSPMYPFPVRIEQAGDRIESVRFFDPANQRSKEDVSELYISPVHMIIPDDETRQQGLRRLLEACEDKGIEKRVRQGLIDDFRHGVRFPGAEFYLPYFFPQLETLFDYLPKEATFLGPR